MNNELILSYNKKNNNNEINLNVNVFKKIKTYQNTISENSQSEIFIEKKLLLFVTTNFLEASHITKEKKVSLNLLSLFFLETHNDPQSFYEACFLTASLIHMAFLKEYSGIKLNEIIVKNHYNETSYEKLLNDRVISHLQKLSKKVNLI